MCPPTRGPVWRVWSFGTVVLWYCGMVWCGTAVQCCGTMCGTMTILADGRAFRFGCHSDGWVSVEGGTHLDVLECESGPLVPEAPVEEASEELQRRLVLGSLSHVQVIHHQQQTLAPYWLQHLLCLLLQTSFYHLLRLVRLGGLCGDVLLVW